MTYKSPLSKLPTARSRVVEYTKSIIPEAISLPDGRVFKVKELMEYKPQRVYYNLQTKERKPVGRAGPKYTLDDRIWQATASPEAIAERYGITLKIAQTLRYKSRYALNKLDIPFKDVDK